jgi:hypothetical protein
MEALQLYLFLKPKKKKLIYIKNKTTLPMLGCYEKWLTNHISYQPKYAHLTIGREISKN